MATKLNPYPKQWPGQPSRNRQPAPAGSWQAQILAAIGAPNTADNATALTLWADSEGRGAARGNNWLAVSDPNQWAAMPPAGSSGWIVKPSGNSGYGVPAWSSQAKGVSVTAAQIQAYPSIAAAFQQNAGMLGIWTAINQSSWCRGCQGGQYPNQLNGSITGVAASGSGPLGAATLGAAGTGATGYGASGNAPNPSANCKPVISGAGITVLNSCQVRGIEGVALMVAGGVVMLIGTVVILFRFKGAQHIAEAAAAAPIAGNAARIIAGRAPRPSPRRASRRQARESTARSEAASEERRVRAAERTQESYDRAQAKEMGAASGRRTGTSAGVTEADRARWREEGFTTDDIDQSRMPRRRPPSLSERAAESRRSRERPMP